MKAVVLAGLKRLELQPHFNDSVPGSGEVVVSVQAASICGSDVRRVVHGEAHTYPMVLGHEVAGVVVQVGANVDSKWLGKRVAIAPLVPCMKCPPCADGRYSGCSHYSFIGSRQNGGFADKVLVPESNLIPVPDSVEIEHAALVEPATVALHALERGGIRPGMRVAILGCGSIGLFTLQWAKIKKASFVLVSDLREENIHLARKMGADLAIDPQKRLVSSAQETPKVDLALETAGQLETLASAIEITRPGGVVVCVGNLPSDVLIKSSFIESLTRKELDVRGTWMSYSAPFPGHEWSETIAAMQRGDLKPELMISHRFPLEDLPQVFEKISEGLRYQKILLQVN